MRIVVAGASGRTGRRVVEASLARGLPTLALVRDPGRLGPRREGLSCLVGDLREPSFLDGKLRPDDVIISALGVSMEAPAQPGLAQTTRALVSALEAVGGLRFLVVLGAGVLFDEDGQLRSAAPDYPPRLQEIGRQHLGALAACAASGLSWVALGCPRIVDGEPSDGFVVRPDHLPPGRNAVRTGNLAALLVREACWPTVSRMRLGVNEADEGGEPERGRRTG